MNEYLIKAGRYSATILDQGAILYSFKIDDHDIILEFEDKSENERTKGYFSQVVGPFANRIKEGKYTLDGVVYQADKNNGNNNLHSGSRNFGWKKWNLVKKSDDSVTLALHSPEGFGFPGNQDVEITYSIDEKGNLTLHYSIVSDKKCPVNLTNHAFFNLSSTGLVLDHKVYMPSLHYIDVDSELIPTSIKETKGTDFDFTTPHAIGERRDGSYDHCFILDGDGKIKVTNGKYSLEVTTDLPAVQLYTSGTLNQGMKGKGGTEMGCHMAFCLETEFYPDFPNRPDFKSCYLTPGVKYETETTYTLTEN